MSNAIHQPIANIPDAVVRCRSPLDLWDGVTTRLDRRPLRLGRGGGDPLVHRNSIYQLSWAYAQDSKVAIDLRTGAIVDLNPALEDLSGFSRAELIGTHLAALAPEDERERVTEELRKTAERPGRYCGFHLQRKDGVCLPINISSSGAVELDGRSVIISELRDMVDQENYENRLAAQNWALSAFSGAALALSRAESEDELLQAICEAITAQSAYLLAYVSIADQGPEELIRFAATSGPAASYVKGLRLSCADGDPDGQGPSGVCIRTNKIYIVDDVEADPSFERWRERARRFGIRSVVGIPLAVEGGWTGALIVFSAESRAFSAEPVQVFQRLGEQIVHGVEALKHKRLLESEQEKLETARNHLTDVLAATVDAMVAATEERDPYTAGHETRVAEICTAIGREMGWDEDRLLGIRLGAMVHDIGKISIPAEILTKPSRLNPAEMELVKLHAETGYKILQNIPFNWPVAQMVRQHHERLDGSGYPAGIKGDEILLESRILAVADMVEAMASDRPYRRSRGLEFALRQIESEAGTRLDAEVVRICAALFREKRLLVPGLKRK